MAMLHSTPTYSASFTQSSSSVDGLSVFEHFEGPASVKGSVSTMVSSSNKLPKDNNPLHCDAVIVTGTLYKTHKLYCIILFIVLALVSKHNQHTQSTPTVSININLHTVPKDFACRKLMKFHYHQLHTKNKVTWIHFYRNLSHCFKTREFKKKKTYAVVKIL